VNTNKNAGSKGNADEVSDANKDSSFGNWTITLWQIIWICFVYALRVCGKLNLKMAD
jgi:hypothetical protein